MQKDRPDIYQQVIKELWEDGKSKIGSLKIKPSNGTKHPKDFFYSNNFTRVPAKPYIGDVDEVKANVLNKNWTQDQLKKVTITPALLMIDTDFDSFDPQENKWLILNFGGHPPHTDYVKELLESIASAVIDGEVDPFKVAHDIQHEIKAHDVVSVFEVKPSVFGISINLLGVVGLIKKFFQKHIR